MYHQVGGIRVCTISLRVYAITQGLFTRHFNKTIEIISNSAEKMAEHNDVNNDALAETAAMTEEYIK